MCGGGLEVRVACVWGRLRGKGCMCGVRAALQRLHLLDDHLHGCGGRLGFESRIQGFRVGGIGFAFRVSVSSAAC